MLKDDYQWWKKSGPGTPPHGNKTRVCVWVSLYVCVCVCWGSNSGEDLQLPLVREHQSAALRVSCWSKYQHSVSVAMGYACLGIKSIRCWTLLQSVNFCINSIQFTYFDLMCMNVFFPAQIRVSRICWFKLSCTFDSINNMKSQTAWLPLIPWLSIIINANFQTPASVWAHYLLLSSLHLHMLQLPEAPHGFHLLQVPVESQPTQPEAVAAVANGLQALHLFDDGGHGYGRWDSWKWELSTALCREGLITCGLLAWPVSTKNRLET